MRYILSNMMPENIIKKKTYIQGKRLIKKNGNKH